MKYPFIRQHPDDLILVSVVIDGRYKLKVAVDTAASHTVLDSNALYMVGYDFRESIGSEPVETANGVISTDIFGLSSLKAVGIQRQDFPIQVYDFLAHGVLSDYHGLLGLDFFEGETICFDFSKNEISIGEHK
jgi:predicted aspartyl protease